MGIIHTFSVHVSLALSRHIFIVHLTFESGFFQHKIEVIKIADELFQLHILGGNSLFGCRIHLSFLSSQQPPPQAKTIVIGN
jgi:hypothetical protein